MYPGKNGSFSRGAGLLLAGVFALWAGSARAVKKPNILLIFTDDQGVHDVGCYGSEIPTPNDLGGHLEGGTGPAERELYWETGTHAELGRSSWSALRKGKWKYVSSPAEGEFLFDIEGDRAETTNLAESRPELFRELRERRDALAREFRGDG